LGGVLLNNRYLFYCTAVVFTILFIAPSIAVAEDNSNEYTNISVQEANKMIKGCSNVFILDVRTPAEYNAAHLKGAHLIPFKNVPAHDPVALPDESLLKARINEVPRDKPVIVYCLTEGRSTNASKLLVENGYTNIYNMQGAIPAWINAGYPVVSTFVDQSGVEGHVKNFLKAQINHVFVYLKIGNDAKANEQLNTTKTFVNKTESKCLITADQAKYLRAEIEEIRAMIK
jgi:rhodanese-related sulfurtransferase